MANAADPKTVRAQGRLLRKREQRYLDATREVLRTPAGRILFLERDRGLVARSGIYATTFAPDALTMAFKEGRRNFGLELLNLLAEADEQAYLEADAEMRGLAQRDENERVAAVEGKHEGDSE